MKVVVNETFDTFQSLGGVENVVYKHCKWMGGLELEECKAIKLEDARIYGGKDNLRLYKCSDCIVVGGVFSDPSRGLPNPEDPENHNVIMDDCDCCEIRGGLMISQKPRGDAINLFNSRHCIVAGTTIEGPIAKHATACIIDGPDGRCNEISKLIFKTKARVVIAGGKKHVLKDLVVPVALEVTGEYYPAATVEDLKMWRVKSPELYIGDRVIRLQEKGCEWGKRTGMHG